MAEMMSDGGEAEEEAGAGLRVICVRRDERSVSTARQEYGPGKQGHGNTEVGWQERRAHVCSLGPEFG